jgi:DNA-binding XRE family transcriptional regulator
LTVPVAIVSSFVVFIGRSEGRHSQATLWLLVSIHPVQNLSDAIAGRIGENIRERRERLLFALDELAGSAGLEEHTLWRIERGTVMPSVLALTRLAQVLECRPGDLLEGVSASLVDGAAGDAQS